MTTLSFKMHNEMCSQVFSVLSTCNDLHLLPTLAIHNTVRLTLTIIFSCFFSRVSNSGISSWDCDFQPCHLSNWTCSLPSLWPVYFPWTLPNLPRSQTPRVVPPDLTCLSVLASTTVSAVVSLARLGSSLTNLLILNKFRYPFLRILICQQRLRILTQQSWLVSIHTLAKGLHCCYQIFPWLCSGMFFTIATPNLFHPWSSTPPLASGQLYPLFY